MKTFIDGNGHECVWVRKKADRDAFAGEDEPRNPQPGPPQPVLLDKLGYALSCGYETCEGPDETPAEPEVIAPEPVVRDGLTIAPEPVQPRRRKPR